MTRRRHTPEQIVRKLREAVRLLGEGQGLAAVGRHLEVSEQTLHRWRAQYGGMKGRRHQTAQGAGEGELHLEAAAGRRRGREGGVEGDRQGNW